MTEYSSTNDIPQYKDVIDDCWQEIKTRQSNGYAGIQFKFPTLNEFATIEKGESFSEVREDIIFYNTKK